MHTGATAVSSRKIIAVVGHPSAGKDTVANYIAEKYSFTHISSGDIVRDYVRAHALGELTRENLQKVGNVLRREHGSGYLSREALKNNAGNLVISGLRTLGELEVVKNAGGGVIAVDAPIRLRYERARARGRISDNVLFADFEKIERQEAANPDRASMNVFALLKQADFTLWNDGSREKLLAAADEGMRKVLG